MATDVIEILYIDDSALDRALVRHALEKDPLGFHVTETSNARDFSARLTNARYDLVLSDFNIAGFEGLQVLKMVQEEQPDCPVIIVTGTGSEEIAVKAMKQGAADYVLKTPTHIQRLPETIRHALHTRSLHQKQQQIAAALQQSETRFRRIFDSNMVGILFWDRSGAVREANSRLLEMLGYTQKDVESGTLNWKNITPPEFAELDVIGLREIDAKGVCNPFQKEYIRKDGSRVPVVLGGAALDEQSGVAFVIDNTEPKRVQKELQENKRFLEAAQQIANLGSWIMLPRPGSLDWSDQVFRIFGLDPRTTRPSNELFFSMVHPDDVAMLRAAARDGFDGKGAYSIDHRIIRPDGEIRWVHEQADYIRDESGMVIQVIGVVNDITERKVADESIRQNEQRFQLINHHVYDWVFLASVEGPDTFRILTVSSSVAKGTGLDGEAIVGRTLEEIFEPAIAGEWKERFRRAIGRKRPLHIEVEDVFPVGKRITFTTLTPIFSADDECTHVLSVAHDITEQKQSEEALRQSETRFRTAFESASIGISLVSPDGHFIRVNEALAEMLGYTIPELQKLTFQAVTHPDDIKRSVDVLGALNKRTQKNWTSEKRYLHKNGSLVWALISTSSVCDPAGRPLYFITMTQDITARKKSEEELARNREWLSAVFAASRDGIMVEADETIVFVNDAYARLFGYEQADLLGKHISTTHSPEDNERLISYGRQRLRGESAPGVYQFKGLRKDGGPVSAEASVSMATIGGKAHIIAAVRDISDRLRLEEQLRHSQRLEAVGRLAGGVAHDFNNMLAVILGYASLMKEDMGADTQLEDSLEQITQSAQRAVGLTRQLLAFSRKQVMSPVVLDLNSIIANTHKLLGRLIGEDIQIMLETSANVGRVKADPGQIEQVIMNLAVNARDAMPRGGTLSITTGSASVPHGTAGELGPGDYVTLTVSDTGTGMSDEVKAHLFEPFFTTKEVGKGTGLGLSTVYGIIKQHEGSITCSSELGRGTTFQVFLPRIAEASIQRETDSNNLAAQRGSETILVVEDEEALRGLARIILEKQGYKVLTAIDGEDALNVALHDGLQIDLLLTDVVMPRLSGPDAALKISAYHPRIRVLFTSGYTENVMLLHGIQDSELAFLQKPYSPVTLIQKVREVLDQPRPANPAH